MQTAHGIRVHTRRGAGRPGEQTRRLWSVGGDKAVESNLLSTRQTGFTLADWDKPTVGRHFGTVPQQQQQICQELVLVFRSPKSKTVCQVMKSVMEENLMLNRKIIGISDRDCRSLRFVLQGPVLSQKHKYA